MAVAAFAVRQEPIGTIVSLPLGMAQLTSDGLSEQWVLRFCGDQHWALIAKALGLPSAVFHATDGRPVYAAFCATSLRLPMSSVPLLGRDVQVDSTLFAVTDTRTGSRHRLVIDGALIAELSMISTFVSHDASGSNTRIYRNSVLGEMHLPPAETGLTQLDWLARDTARSLHRTAPDRATEIFSERPTPSLDFNAVGLLYFPTFSRIVETAVFVRSGRPVSTVGRDVVYLGNINHGDTVHVFDHGAMALMTRGDGTLIAAIRTLTAPERPLAT